MSTKKITILIIPFIILFLPIFNASSQEMSTKLKGKILLQVERHGEAWYVNPKNEKRYFLGRPKDAFEVMRELGIGISNKDLYKIPIGISADGFDTDGDGLSDSFEKTLGLDINKSDTDGDGYTDKAELENGFNPWGEGKQNINKEFALKQTGKIFLQIEEAGEAWYVNPADNKRYFLGRPKDAFNIMRKLGLGVKDQDISSIEIEGEGPATTTPIILKEKIVIKEVEKVKEEVEEKTLDPESRFFYTEENNKITIEKGNTLSKFLKTSDFNKDIRVFSVIKKNENLPNFNYVSFTINYYFKDQAKRIWEANHSEDKSRDNSFTKSVIVPRNSVYNNLIKFGQKAKDNDDGYEFFTLHIEGMLIKLTDYYEDGEKWNFETAKTGPDIYSDYLFIKDAYEENW